MPKMCGKQELGTPASERLRRRFNGAAHYRPAKRAAGVIRETPSQLYRLTWELN